MARALRVRHAALFRYEPDGSVVLVAVRATGTGSSSSFGRIGSVSAPILVGLVYPTLGFLGVFAMTTTVLLVGACVVGFLGIESARGADGFGITVSYWDSLEAIRNWKDVPSHAAVQVKGKQTFYERYEVRVCTVERGYKFPS